MPESFSEALTGVSDFLIDGGRTRYFARDSKPSADEPHINTFAPASNRHLKHGSESAPLSSTLDPLLQDAVLMAAFALIGNGSGFVPIGRLFLAGLDGLIRPQVRIRTRSSLSYLAGPEFGFRGDAPAGRSRRLFPCSLGNGLRPAVID